MNLPSLLRNQALPCAITLSLLAAGSASAADGTWTGGTSTIWADPANWSGFVPGGSSANSDLATFNSGTYSFAPTAASSYFIGGLIFGSSSGAITITTGTGNARLNVDSGGIEMKSGTGAVNIGASLADSQGASIVANQNWANNSSSLLTVNRVSVDNASSAGTYTLTINGSGSGGVNFLNTIGDVNGASSATTLFALQINSTGGNTIISSGNSFSGGTTLTQGNLLLGNNTALGTGGLALNGGKISSSSTGTQLPANNTTIGGNVTLGDAVNDGKLTFSGTIGLGGATRTLTTDSLVEFTGVVGGAGGIIKQGTSTLRLLGENTYTGGTTISSGILQIGLGGTSGSVVGDIAVDGELIFNKTDSAVLSNTLTGTGVLTKNGAGTLILTTAASAFSGTTTTSGGVLALSNANALSNSVLQLNADGNRIAFVLPDATDYRLGGLRGTAPTLVIGSNSLTLGKDAGTNTSFGGVISGTGGLTKVGSSTQTLAGTNTYSGTTTVSVGTLSVNGSTAGGAVSVSSGATLAGSGTVGGATTINSGAFHSPGNSPGVQTFTNGLTYSNGSTFVWELTGNTDSGRGTAFDGVNVSGGLLTIDSGVTNNLVFNGAGSTVSWSDAFWASNQQWLVFSNASLPTVSSNVFETINVGVDSISQSLTSVRSGSSFSWDTIGDDLYLTYAIPEPSTYALLALLGAGFAGRALVRRRRRHGVD